MLTVEELIKELEKLPKHYNVRVEHYNNPIVNFMEDGNQWIRDMEQYKNDHNDDGEVVIYISE